ncbi:hypothetical protein [Flavobacterium sp.]|uniref:hypothetical protein n=1 Tax=Flavobacterium sp. TaxID=239 RepID=UPI00374CA787
MQKKHYLQKFLKTPLKITDLLDIKNASRKNIAKNMHFVQKICKREELIFIFDRQQKPKKT